MCSRIQKYWPVWTNTNVVHVKFNGLRLFFVLEMIVCQKIIQLSHHRWRIVCTLWERWCLKIKKAKVHIKWAAHLLLPCKESSLFIIQYEGFEHEDSESISQIHRALITLMNISCWLYFTIQRLKALVGSFLFYLNAITQGNPTSWNKSFH